MAISHLASGEVISLLGEQQPSQEQPDSETLVRDDHFQVFRYVLPAGKLTPMHEAAGILTIQCLSGEVELEAHQRRQHLRSGDFVYLADAEPHAVKALTDAVLLLSLVLHRR